MKDESVIISPDTLRQQRIPPGQRETGRFPVLHHGEVPRLIGISGDFSLAAWYKIRRPWLLSHFQSCLW
jgi:hypothetical protein